MTKRSKQTQKHVTVRGVCVIRYKKDRDNWELDAGLKLGGPNKHRKRYPTLEAAKTAADELSATLKNQGTDGFKLSREEQVDAEKALKILKETKFSSLSQALEFAQRYAGENLPDTTISELIVMFREKKEEEKALNLRGASEATLKEYKYRHGLFDDHFGEMLVRDFTENDFKPFFSKMGFSPQLLSKIKTLFNYAVKEGIIPENPIKIEAPKKKMKTPKVFSDSDWRKLVLTSLYHQDHRFSKGEPVDLLAYVVLGLWCGLRPNAELERLNWSDIHLDDHKPMVYIHAEWKVTHARWVDIPECAVALLKLCINQKGAVVKPKNFRRRLDWLKEEAGVKESWSPDIMRHTFASMHYGLHGDKNAIANQLGHVGQGVLDHYMNTGKNMKQRAKEFFSFTAPLPASAEPKAKSA
jgi:integrase